ncbi:MAG: phage tail assembly protein [Sphingomonadales bacterium]|nr:phage tail assembly protein [Sphingomonadales bacterium]MBD3772126.1 phage tail assembly protein [Paracoccaceae bacterium]
MSGQKARVATHQLKHPIILETLTAGSDEPSEEVLKPAGHTVTVRRAKAKDMRLIDQFGDGQPIALTLAMIGRLSNLDHIEIENLDPEDMEELGNLALPDKVSGRPTGETA